MYSNNISPFATLPTEPVFVSDKFSTALSAKLGERRAILYGVAEGRLLNYFLRRLLCHDPALELLELLHLVLGDVLVDYVQLFL
jgi:hypothetical protein